MYVYSYYTRTLLDVRITNDGLHFYFLFSFCFQFCCFYFYLELEFSVILWSQLLQTSYMDVLYMSYITVTAMVTKSHSYNRR